MIAYVALFSALLSRLTALACDSTWLTSFLIARFLNIHRSGALAWLVPHETAAVSAQVLFTPYNHAPCHFMQSHIRKVYACLAVTCHLHFWAGWPGSFTCCCGKHGDGTDTEIRVSTKSRPWRRKFSRRSCRGSDPRPFNHESGALATELSPSPRKSDDCKNAIPTFGRETDSYQYTIQSTGCETDSCTYTVPSFGRETESCKHTIHSFVCKTCTLWDW